MNALTNGTSLYALMEANPALRFADAVTGAIYTLPDFHHSLHLPGEKGLAFLYTDNRISSVEVLLNFLRSGWTMCLLSSRLDPAFKERLEAQYNPACIYDCSRQQISGYRSFVAAPDTVFQVAEQTPAYAIHPRVKLLLSTSGSTGSPRFVKLSEANLVANALSILDYLPVGTDDVTPLNLPLYYAYGLSVFTTNAIAGGTLVCSDRDIMQREFWADWNNYGFTSLAGVPYVYEMLARLGFQENEYPSLRYLTQAGGKMNSALVRQFGTYAAARGIPFYVMYGQTEATARMSYLSPDELLQRPGSIGKPVKNGHFELDPMSSELLYRGPNISGGYAERPEDLASFDPPGILHTGDIARKDEEGFYYITGRMKRFVKLFGNRINLDESEQLLKDHFPGRTFLCIGREDRQLVVVHSDAGIDPGDVKKMLAGSLKVHPSVIRIEYIGQIPLTANGKADYAAAGALI